MLTVQYCFEYFFRRCKCRIFTVHENIIVFLIWIFIFMDENVSRDHNLFFFIIKPTRCTISQIYFGIELYMFRTGLLSIIRSLVLCTQQQVYVIQVMLTVC